MVSVCAMDATEGWDPETAGQHLYDLIVDMKMRSRLTAVEACHLAYWATMAGAQGVKKLAKSPGASRVGHYSSFVDRVVGTDLKSDPRFGLLDVTMYFCRMLVAL